jgi:hypothetical protein
MNFCYKTFKSLSDSLYLFVYSTPFIKNKKKSLDYFCHPVFKFNKKDEKELKNNLDKYCISNALVKDRFNHIIYDIEILAYVETETKKENVVHE